MRMHQQCDRRVDENKFGIGAIQRRLLYDTSGALVFKVFANKSGLVRLDLALEA